MVCFFFSPEQQILNPPNIQNEEKNVPAIIDASLEKWWSVLVKGAAGR